MLTLGHALSILFILSQNLLNSSPFLIYSALLPQASTEVKIINSFTLPSSSILLIFSINLSTKLSGIPRLELIAKLSFLLGLGLSIIKSNTFQVSFDSNGSPPVILKVCKSL